MKKFKAMVIDYLNPSFIGVREFTGRRFETRSEAIDFFIGIGYFPTGKKSCDLICYLDGKKDMGIKIVEV